MATKPSEPEQSEHEALMHYIGERQPHPELNAKQNAILWALKQGSTRTAAAGFAGVHKDTLYEWLKQNPTFSDAVTRAEATAEVGFTSIVALAAMGGDWRAAQFWLETRRRRDYGKQIDIRKIDSETLLQLLEDDDPDSTRESSDEGPAGGGAARTDSDDRDRGAAAADTDRGTADSGQAGADHPASAE